MSITEDIDSSSFSLYSNKSVNHTTFTQLTKSSLVISLLIYLLITNIKSFVVTSTGDSISTLYKSSPNFSCNCFLFIFNFKKFIKSSFIFIYPFYVLIFLVDHKYLYILLVSFHLSQFLLHILLLNQEHFQALSFLQYIYYLHNQQ